MSSIPRKTTSSDDQDEARKIEEKKAQKEAMRQKRIEEFKQLNERKQKQQQLSEEAAIRLGKNKNDYSMRYYFVFAGLGVLVLALLVMLYSNQPPNLSKTLVYDEKSVQEHNNNFPWKQGQIPFWEGRSLANAKKIFQTKFSSTSQIPACRPEEEADIPASFDVRTQWPECVLPVANQEPTCEGSYAIAVSQTLAERICIASNDHKLTPLSAQELLSCDKENSGCKGGYLNHALQYVQTSGLSEETCFPYTGKNEECGKMCENPTKVRASFCYLTEDSIKREILKNGPVIAVMYINVDFLTYKSGIYIPGEGVPRFSEGTAIKIIGWGTENEDQENTGNQYWLVQLSWGDSWGENGVAKIINDPQLFNFSHYAFSIITSEQVLKFEQEQKAKADAAASETAKEKDIPDMSLDNETEAETEKK